MLLVVIEPTMGPSLPLVILAAVAAVVAVVRFRRLRSTQFRVTSASRGRIGLSVHSDGVGGTCSRSYPAVLASEDQKVTA